MLSDRGLARRRESVLQHGRGRRHSKLRDNFHSGRYRDETLRDRLRLCIRPHCDRGSPRYAMTIQKHSSAFLHSQKAVARKIAAVSTDSKIVVEKSTVPVKTGERIRFILDSNKSRECISRLACVVVCVSECGRRAPMRLRGRAGRRLYANQTCGSRWCRIPSSFPRGRPSRTSSSPPAS